MATLYRKYRPQRFASVQGQEHITAPLQKAVETDSIAHAYLFHGPRGTGKTTTARLLAARLNCLKPKKSEPCGTCQQCQATTEGSSPDVIEIDAASNRGIDDIRDLKERLQLAPVTGSYKVYIIDEVHMLTKEAFTALLKTLEEPSSSAVFILATTDFHKVPDTITSRCQVYRFRRASDEELGQRLKHILKQEKRTVSEEALSFVIGRSDGCYRDAESLLGQVLTLEADEITTDLVTDLLGLPSVELLDGFLNALVEGDSVSALRNLDEAAASGLDPEQFVQEAIVRARTGAVELAHGSSGMSFSNIEGAAEKLPAIIRTLIQAQQDLQYVPQPQVALHLAVLSVCTPSSHSPASGAVVSSKPTTASRNETGETPEVAEDDHSSPTGEVKEGSTATPTEAENPELLEKAQQGWPSVIDGLRGKNPVASTFVRAMEPVATAGSAVVIATKYPLHQNFFEKEANRAMLEEALSQVTGTETAVRLRFSEASKPKVTTEPQKDSQLLDTVKEVFGS